MNEAEKKQLNDAMKKVYGGSKQVPKEKVEEELDSIGEEFKEPPKAAEFSVEVRDVEEKEEPKPEVKSEIKPEVKKEPEKKIEAVKELSSENEKGLEMSEKQSFSEHAQKSSISDKSKTSTKQPTEEIKPEIVKKGLVVSSSPHIRDRITINSIMWSVIIALLPATAAGIYFFGINALIIILLSVISALATELLIFKLTKKEITIDGSAILTGLLLALILPPTTPFWVPILGAIFAIGIGKMIFGGLGHNIFNPALAGRAFLVVSFPVIMTSWILPDGITGATPLGLLKLEGVIQASYSQLFIGNIGGTIGETSALALLIGAAFLFYKKIIDWRIPSTYIGTVLIFALIFRQDPIFHLLAGSLLIGAFFMATDYVTAPITKNGRLIFGFGCGFLTIIIRLFGGYPEGVMFSILLMNAATPLIDRLTTPKPFGSVPKKKKQRISKASKEQEEIKAKVDQMLKKKNEAANK